MDESWLMRWYRHEMFTPSPVGILINPFYLLRRGLYTALRRLAPQLRGRLLDFGCGRKPYRRLFAVQEYMGLDIDHHGHDHRGEAIDVYYHGTTLPFADGHFDAVFSSEVFEHVFNLKDMLRELHRVTRSGGLLLFTCPFAWGEHEAPFDYARYTSFGIRDVVQQAGFEIVSAEKTGGSIAAVFQLWNVYVSQECLPRNRIIKLLLNPLLVAPMTVLALLLGMVLPKGDDLYCNHVILARKP